MRYIVLFVLVSCAFTADPPGGEPKLPVDVQKVVDDRESAVAKAKATYDAAVAKATTDAVAKLEKIVTATTKKGDLAGANAGQKVVEEWKALLASDLLVSGKPAKDAGKEFVGRWTISAAKHGGTVITIKEDKSADFGDRVGWGTWTVSDDGLTIAWKSGYDYKIVKKGSDLTFTEQKGEIVFADGKLVK